MYGLRGGFTAIGSPNSSFRAAGNSFSINPRNRMLNPARPSASSVPPSDHIHEKKNTPCVQPGYVIHTQIPVMFQFMCNYLEPENLQTSIMVC
jgi:hypothetical protein